MAPLEVSYVSTDIEREQGVPEVNVAVTPGTMIVREPEPPELAKASLTDDDWPAVNVNVVAAPIAVPAAEVKVTDPVQDAAVPEVVFEAEL